jgi:hypothetical protein
MMLEGVKGGVKDSHSGGVKGDHLIAFFGGFRLEDT